ncbi:translation initiation factor IF-2 N-terminal domain-containing protein [Prochlorococcus sp. MIT 1300]|uniref:translation initiation factor IF-2 N-terminal domain-containing protein n=1 Tax=Prochlorococcus sp. MIT 1300 TaxID=3096218 RepID=UPI002A753738|nr:hypothetical protein [Prochlorococcus sp. MIT 1300]
MGRGLSIRSLPESDMTIRVLELAEKLKVGTDDLLAVCTLLEIPATSRISCLSPEHIKKLTAYYQEKSS